MRPPREFSLGFGAIKASFWRCSDLLPEVPPVFDRTEATLEQIFSIYARILEVYLEMRPTREFSLEFSALQALFWRCSDLLSDVSPIFDRTEAVLGDTFPSYASLPEVSLEMHPPREFSLGLGAIKACFWCCSGLLREASPVFYRT